MQKRAGGDGIVSAETMSLACHSMVVLSRVFLAHSDPEHKRQIANSQDQWAGRTQSTADNPTAEDAG